VDHRFLVGRDLFELQRSSLQKQTVTGKPLALVM